MSMKREPTLSDAQVAQYYREGYLVLPQLATPSIVDGVLDTAKQFPVETGGSWTPRIFDHDEPLTEPDFHKLLTDPRIVGAVEQIFESVARVFYGMLAVVPAQGGKGLEWHQDNQYTQIMGRALNMFVAVDDITPDMAILWVSPGSHKWGIQPSETQSGHKKAKDPGNGIALPAMKKGDVALFDRYTLHRSLTNSTDRHRYAYAAQYQEFNARAAETGEKEAKRMTVDRLAEQWEASLV